MGDLEFRTIEPHERDAVLDLLGQWLNDRAFFARYFEHDPTFRDDLCFVATDKGRIVSTLQVFRKQIRINGRELQLGGVGNVFTAAAYRERGAASQLLARAIAAMETHGFDLSLLFATRLVFYGRLGWQSHIRHFVFLEPAPVAAADRYAIESFAEADLDAVMRMYDSYNAGLSGSTLRDRCYWQGQLRYAGNTREDFRVARAGTEIVAYARGTELYGFYVIMEHGCLPGYEDALADVVCHLHGTAAAGSPGTITQLAFAPGVQQRLHAYGLRLRTIEDAFWMWRLIAPQQLAAKLGMDEATLTADDILFRLLPPERSVYWMADRF
ncbi:MAG: GNAT family N-acetyltransferase [Candidatus Binatia bacterium]